MKRYIIETKLTPGSFGKILLCYDTKLNKRVILKIEPSDKKLLQKEYNFYTLLNHYTITPTCYKFKSNEKFNLLFIEYYGHDLKYWLNKQTNITYKYDKYFTHFNIRDILIISYGLIKILQILHLNNIIYHDIKPNNFLLNTMDNLTIDNIHEHLKIIDFGLSAQLTPEQLKQTKYIVKSDKGLLSGTIRYCSKNAYNGYEQTYKDDFESMIYLIIYLYNGYLPWQSNLNEHKINKEDIDLEKFIPKELYFLLPFYNKNMLLDFNKHINYNILLKCIHQQIINNYQ